MAAFELGPCMHSAININHLSKPQYFQVQNMPFFTQGINTNVSFVP